MRALLHNLWNARVLNLVRAHYAQGHCDHEAFVLGLLSQSSDLHLSIDHTCALGSARRGFRVATRWTVQGTHDGSGRPTGRRVRLLGVSHNELRGGQVVQEWTLFDDYALLSQLHAPLAEEHAPFAAPYPLASEERALP